MSAKGGRGQSGSSVGVVSAAEDKDTRYTLPAPIKDFVFDMHDAMMRSKYPEEVQSLYEIKFKEITEKFFHNSRWPAAHFVSDEVNGDEFFLLFYSEMTFRHVTTKLKPNLAEHLASWTNYVKLFELISKCNESDLCIPTQWIYDITQEFAYQFQGFCQFRCQVKNQSPETLKTLEANRDAWALPSVVAILRGLIKRAAAIKSSSGNSSALVLNSSSLLVQFGYFASIELARLECLMGDFSASLSAINSIKLNDRSELFVQLPLCHFNVYYHTGICYMMLRKFAAALDVFSEICLHVSRISKPGAATPGLRAGPQQLQRMLDKVLVLTAIASTLCPGSKLDDQVNEMIEGKIAEKVRRLEVGDRSVYLELMELASPKFISPLVPDYSTGLSVNQEAATHIQSIFMTEIDQNLSFLKLRSFLGLYATIEVSKLARFNDVADADLCSQLLSFKNKIIAAKAAAAQARERIASSSDVHFFVECGSLVVNTASSKNTQMRAQEKFFIAGVRKHVEILQQVKSAFKSCGLE